MINILLVFVSLFGIVKSAGYFIDQSIAIAKRYHLSSFVIGFTIVALGTSLPELVIGLYSSYSGAPSIAVSSIIGSNITNSCLVLGLLATLRAYKLTKSDVQYNIPLNLTAIIAFIGVIYFGKGTLTAIGGAALLVLFIISLILAQNNNHKIYVKSTVKFNIFVFIFSLLALVFFGKLTVDYTLKASEFLGIAKSTIGYIVIAIGTSIPELVALFTAIKKGDEEIGLGSILGSNMFNLLFVLGSSAFITNINFEDFYPELYLLLITTIVILILAKIGKKYFYSKAEGIILISIYIVFVILVL